MSLSVSISTAEILSACLFSAEGILSEVVGDQGEKLETQFFHIEALINRATTEGKAIDLVVVDCGPGSFTALRAGIAFGKGLAAGLGARIITVSTEELTASMAQAREAPSRAKLVALGYLSGTINESPEDRHLVHSF
ncbi:MAG: hypothetical protein ACKN97_09165 [Acidobacteriota bacterium]